MVTKQDGSTFALTNLHVTCALSRYGHGVQVVHASAVGKQFSFFADVVPADVVGGKTFKLPISSGDVEQGPKNAFVFLGTRPEIEASTDQESAQGTLRVDHASCNPASLDLTVDATLGSELSDGQRVTAKGRLSLRD